MINIGRDNADASYRYKMPRLVTKIEGRGNGIKTVIVNMVDVAKALRVEPNYPTKFFGIELGAQSKFSAKDERAIVNGAHQSGDLAKLLDKFIDIFVLCPTCKLPEIKMSLKKSQLKIDCAACGHNGVLKTAHKLATYIAKNPPESKKGHMDESGSDDEKETKTSGPRKGTKDAKESKDESDDETPSPAAAAKKEKVVWHTDTSAEAQKKRQDEELASMRAEKKTTSPVPQASTPEAAESKADVTPSSAIDNIISSAGKPALVAAESPVQMLKSYISQGKKSPEEVLAELKRLQLARGFDDNTRFKTLLEAVFDLTKPNTITAQIKTQAPILKRAAKGEGKVFMANVENLVGVTEVKLLPYTPHILQGLYDADVLSEATILSWADTPAEASWLAPKDVAAAVRKRAAPFVHWLRTADEEDD